MTLPATAPDPDEDRVVPFPGGAPDTSQPTLDVPLDVKSEQIRLLREHPSLIRFLRSSSRPG
jgi:hypothetical protein